MKTLWSGMAVGVGLLLALAAGGAERTDPASGSAVGAPETNRLAKATLPRLVDLGADKCVPCKAMAPILAELKKAYIGQLDVEFIDVWKKPDAAKPYKIKLIPTQIFYDSTGKERFRHEGFFSKADILAKWKELGVELKPGKPEPKGASEAPERAK